MTFKEKIENLRKGASEAQSASKIIDKPKPSKTATVQTPPIDGFGSLFRTPKML